MLRCAVLLRELKVGGGGCQRVLLVVANALDR